MIGNLYDTIYNNLYLYSCLSHMTYYKKILKIKLKYWLPGITIITIIEATSEKSWLYTVDPSNNRC